MPNKHGMLLVKLHEHLIKSQPFLLHHLSYKHLVHEYLSLTVRQRMTKGTYCCFGELRASTSLPRVAANVAELSIVMSVLLLWPEPENLRFADASHMIAAILQLNHGLAVVALLPTGLLCHLDKSFRGLILCAFLRAVPFEVA